MNREHDKKESGGGGGGGGDGFEMSKAHLDSSVSLLSICSNGVDLLFGVVGAEETSEGRKDRPCVYNY